MEGGSFQDMVEQGEVVAAAEPAAATLTGRVTFVQPYLCWILVAHAPTACLDVWERF
jgi:hypothetical protein